MTAEVHAFDRLRFDVLWETQMYFDLFGCEARLSVRTDDTEPAPWQRIVFDVFMKHQAVLKPKVYAALLQHYQSIVDEYREMFSSEHLHLVPRISSVEELSRVITPEAVYIGDLHPEDPEVGVLFDCTWDISHGVGVRLRGDAVLEVGPQDICL